MLQLMHNPVRAPKEPSMCEEMIAPYDEALDAYADSLLPAEELLGRG